jgi:hypothetical protein
MRDGAPRIGRPRRHNTTVDQHAALSKLGFVRHSEEFVVDRVAWGEADRRPSQKLPPTAILEPQNRYACFNRYISFLASRGRAAAWAPGSRTVSGAVRSLGPKLSSRARLSHDRRIRRQSENVAHRCDRLGHGRRQKTKDYMVQLRQANVSQVQTLGPDQAFDFNPTVKDEMDGRRDSPSQNHGFGPCRRRRHVAAHRQTSRRDEGRESERIIDPVRIRLD